MAIANLKCGAKLGRYFWWLALLSGVALAALICRFGNGQLGGNDQGVLVDSAYRLFCGYHPYIDFPTTHPILFSLGSLWALKIFGVSWSAFVYVTALYELFSFALLLTLFLRIGVPKLEALFTVTAVEAMALVSGSYWWYNPASCIAVILVCSAALLVLMHPQGWVNWGLYTFCLFLVSMAKPNVAGVAILSCTLGLLLHPQTRLRVIASSVLALCLHVALLTVYHISLLDMLSGYLGGAGRGVPSWERFAQDQPPVTVIISVILLLIPVMIFIISCVRSWRDILHQPLLRSVCFLSMGCLIAGIYGCFTNGELKVLELPMLLVPSVLFLNILGDRQYPILRKALFVGVTLGLLVALDYGATRYRVECIGKFAFYEKAPMRKVGPLNHFFCDLKAGPVFLEILWELNNIIGDIKTKGVSNPSVLFGPRMNWGYAAYGLMPPKHLPYSWWAGVDYPSKLLPEIIDAFEMHPPKYCIFFGSAARPDFTYMPEEIVKILATRYHIYAASDLLLVLELIK